MIEFVMLWHIRVDDGYLPCCQHSTAFNSCQDAPHQKEVFRPLDFFAYCVCVCVVVETSGNSGTRCHVVC